MTAKCHPSSFSSLPLPLLVVLLLALFPVSQEEPPSEGGDLSSSDGGTTGLGDDLLHGEEESSDDENDPSPSESKGESPFVKILARVNSSEEGSSDNELEDGIISWTSAVNTVQRVMPDVRHLRRESLRVGSAAATDHRTSVRNTLSLCKSIYMSDYGVYPRDHAFVYVYRHEKHVYPMIIFVQKKFVDLCRPLLIREDCEEVKYLTICAEAQIGFLHSHGCQIHEGGQYEKLLARHALRGNTDCFEGLCDGSFTLIESSIGGIAYQIFNIILPYDNKVCDNALFSSGPLKDGNNTVYLTQNNKWPCCYAMYLVAWQHRPEEHNLIGNWSYLPVSCRVGEVLLIVMVAAVGLSGVLGNLIVVVVMLSSAHRGQESSLLRTSLAFSDLFLGVFVVLPSLFHHLAPFFSEPEYMTFTGNERLQILPAVKRVKRDTPDVFLTNAVPSRDRFILFQSLVYGTCSLVSLSTLCLLSTERLVMTGRALRYKHYFTRGRIKAAIAFTWVLGLLETLLTYYDRDGNISTMWSTFSKIPYKFPKTNPSTLAYAFFSNMHVSLYMLVGTTTVVFSVLALYNFVQEQSRVKTEWHSLGIKTTVLYYQENRRIITTMTLMIILYLASVVPILVLIIINLMQYGFTGIYLFGHLAIWLFLASSAWNPWLYNMRSSQFTGDLAQLLHKVLPTSLGKRLRPCMTYSHYGKERDDIELTPGREKMLFRLGLAET